MNAIKRQVAEKIAHILEGIDPSDIASMMEEPPNSDLGDLSLPCFRLSKRLRKSPQAIAEQVKSLLNDPMIAQMDVVSGYLNMTYNNEWIRHVMQRLLKQKEQYGSQQFGRGKTIVIDYSSPNIAKPFHIAHLRSTVIGHALKQICSFMGFQVVGINHLGDWGTQFGKLIVAYERWGKREHVEQHGIDELLRLYVKFHEEVDNDPSLDDLARNSFAQLEQGNEEVIKLWQWFVDISLEEFQKIYRLLGVQFDSYAGESFYNDQMSQVIAELEEKNLLVEDEGALIVSLDEYGMPPALILKRDGSSLYHTRDITAAIYRKNTYDFHKAIYVTDYAQNLHFKQWFKVVKLLGYTWANDLEHVAFGRVSMEGMSFSTRKGNVIKLEEVLKRAIEQIKGIIEQRNPHLDNKDEVAEQVGVGAIIFNDLKGNRMSDIHFSWDAVLNFDGETGPYVQYTYARTCSVMRRARMEKGLDIALECGGDQIDFSQLQNEEAIAVVRTLSQFEESVEQAYRKREPSIITRYTIELARTFNRFYHQCHVLVDDPALCKARLALVYGVQIVLKTGLRLIGLAAPEEI